MIASCTCLVVSKLSLFQDVPQAIQEFSISALCAKAGVLTEQRIKFFRFEDIFGMSTNGIIHYLMADKMIILDASGIHFMYRYRMWFDRRATHTKLYKIVSMLGDFRKLYSQQFLLSEVQCDLVGERRGDSPMWDRF